MPQNAASEIINDQPIVSTYCRTTPFSKQVHVRVANAFSKLLPLQRQK